MLMTWLVAFVTVLVGAVLAGTYALVTERQRRALLARASGGGESVLVMRQAQPTTRDRLLRLIRRRVPKHWAARGAIASSLVQAGFDGPTAPLVYTIARVAGATLLPLVALLLFPRAAPLYTMLGVVACGVVGFLAPPAVIENRARTRQEQIQRQLPDCLDLLVVCVEAGVSLDAALLRVAREMTSVHPELSSELQFTTRRINAGMPREQALHGMYQRTGVDELRTLVANMIQSERWGTSIATTLRVYAEGLRRRRKQAAEKKAATTPLKMMIPLALFVFPVVFVVVLGPAVMKITAMFDANP